jgi:hypothetical protein
MEHALHISAKHFIQKIARDDLAGGQDNADDQEFEPGDALGKALALCSTKHTKTRVGAPALMHSLRDACTHGLNIFTVSIPVEEALTNPPMRTTHMGALVASNAAYR